MKQPAYLLQMSGHYTSKLNGEILSTIIRTVHCLIAAWAIVAAASQSGAQPATGTITGVVTGESGSPMAGVTVTVRNQATARADSDVTDPDGRFAIAGLSAPGEYAVAAAVGGFEADAGQPVQLTPGGVKVVNFRLDLTVRESIAVTAQTPANEPGHSELQQRVGETLTHELPLAGRSFITVAMLAAGFTGNPEYPNVMGQAYWTNNVIVDGASHFSKWRSAARQFHSGYGLETIREVRVLTNRFSAEYGDALASVTTAVTRSGTDQFRGAGLVFLQDDKLYATPVFASINPPAGSERLGFTLGGPFAKERTHFFGSYEARRTRNHNVVVSGVAATAGALVPDDEDEHLAFMRVDDRRDGSSLISLRYNGQFFRWRHEPGGVSQPGSGVRYRNDAHTALATSRRIYSDRMYNELRGQFARYTDVRTDLNPGVFVSRAGYSQEGGTLGPFGYGADPEDTWEAADHLSLTPRDHALRIGGGVKRVAARNVFLNYGRGAYFFAGAPGAFPEPYLFVQGVVASDQDVRANPRALAGSAFVQDDWRVRRGLTLNLGLRYDVERVTNVRHFTAPADRDNLQPRVGFAWEPRASGSLIVRGGAGVYTQQHLLLYINRVQLEGPDGAATIALTPGSPLFPAFPGTLSGLPAGTTLPPRDIHQVASDFHNPYALQMTVGAERPLGPLTLSADYVFLDGRDLMSLVDANAPASNIKPAQRSTAEADATRPLRPVPGGVRNLWTLGNQGRSWYRALQVKAERSSGRFHTLVSYSLARAEDAANYQIPEDSRNLDAERARADADVRHNLSAGFTWQLSGSRAWSRGWSLSGIGAARSGRPYTIVWGDDRNGTTQNDARPGKRNTATTAGYRNVDLAIVRRIALGTARLDARVEAFNVFNVTNYDQYVGSLQSPLFSRPVSAFPKRRLQLAAIVRF